MSFVYKPMIETKDDLLSLKPVDHEARWIDAITELWVYSERGWEPVKTHSETDRNGPIGAAESILNDIVDLIKQVRVYPNLLEETTKGPNWAWHIDEGLTLVLQRAAPYRYDLTRRDMAENELHKSLKKFVKRT